MRLPIQHCLFHPERRPGPLPPLDLAALGRLDFEPVDDARFPCFRLAREAMRAGGLACAALNAANEIAVADFLAGRVGFMDIPAIVEATLAALPSRSAVSAAPSQLSCPPALEEVLATDAWAREFASTTCQSL
jgi:1-deoxy-D-xylulose-5-phosphate reductoisomerase